MTQNKYRQELLIKLLRINSISGSEQQVADIVTDELKNIGFKVKQDKLGNVYATRGRANQYPLLNAHMDIVELWYNVYSYTNKEKENYDYYDYMFDYESNKDTYFGESEIDDAYKSCANCYYNQYCDVLNQEEFICSAYKQSMEIDAVSRLDSVYMDRGYSVNVDKNGCITGSGEQRVLGGDDKCGLFIALEVARTTTHPMKILFTVQEEVGLVGMDFVASNHENWFDDVKYSITIDRRNSNEMLISQLNTKSCSKDFARMVFNSGKSAGINVKIEDGSMADVVVLRDLVDNAINISAGYYDAHTEYEYVEYDEVVMIIEWVKNILKSNNRFSRKRYYDIEKLKKELGIFVPTTKVQFVNVTKSKK